MACTASPFAADIKTQVSESVIEGDGDQQVVDVIAAEMRVAIGGDHFEYSIVQLKDGDVEGAAAEIVDGNDAVLLFVETVGQRCRGRFVDQTQNFKAGDAASVFCGLTLRIVEVRGHGDDGFRDGRSEEAFGIAFELTQNQGRNLRRSKCLIAELDAQNFARVQILGKAEREKFQLFLNVVDPSSHQAFDRVDGALRRLG